MPHTRPVLVAALLGLVMSVATVVPARAATLNAAPDISYAAPMADELFHLTGALTDPAGSRTIVLQAKQYASADWRNVSTQSSTNGEYDFRARISTPRYFRVWSPATAPETAGEEAGTIYTPARRVTVAAQYVAAWATRTCGTDNRCGGQAKASGYVRPIRANRRVVLQFRTTDGWKSTSVRGYTDTTGRFELPFDISRWPQWTARKLRVAAGSFGGSAAAVSAPISFMPGPKVLGRNVLRVDVAGGTFPTDKGTDYRGYATLSRDGAVLIDRARLDKFGVRGSSTAKFAKKPYNLRFAVAPSAPVFGMDADRAWTLLAMFIDQSFVRDKTALDLGRKLSGMTWNPDSEYVEMFVNSEYKGAYLMTEKVKIDSDRVAVDPDTGMIMEVDGRNVSDPTLGFRAPHGLVFAFKEPDGYNRKSDGTYGSEGVTPSKLRAIRAKVSAVESILYSTNRKYWTSVIEPLSAVDFYLAMEYFKDNDSDFWRSKYFSWDPGRTCGNTLCDGRLHFGPLWDFDRGAGNQTGTSAGSSYVRSPVGWNANGKGIGYDDRPTYTTHWYVQMWKISAFRAKLWTRWDVVRPHFRDAWNLEVARNKALIGVGAYNDRARWAGEPKWYKAKGPTYNDEVSYVKYWLANRFAWMDSQLN